MSTLCPTEGLRARGANRDAMMGPRRRGGMCVGPMGLCGGLTEGLCGWVRGMGGGAFGEKVPSIPKIPEGQALPGRGVLPGYLG